MRRMLTAKLQNRSGVLNRFTGVLSRRQVNIESISVGASEDPNVSRITIIIDVNTQNEVEQIVPTWSVRLYWSRCQHQLLDVLKSWQSFNPSVLRWWMLHQALSLSR